MANINLRLYGDQIYPNISKYLSSYISPYIEKENFLEMYNNGLVEMKDIKLKEELVLHPQIRMMEGSMGELILNIPNETENFSINLNNMKFSLRLSDIKEEEIESILVKNKKKLIDDFIKYSISKIEKKDGSSFLDNLIKSFLDKILNGLIININNLELKVNIDNDKNKNFLFKIDNINYNVEKGIKIKNIELIYEEKNIKTNVIQKFDFNIDIIKSEDDKPNKLNLTISDFSFEINKNIYFEFLNYYNLFDRAEYKKIYLKYKKLIQYQRPAHLNDDAKKDYKSLWKYAIKTVIKLQKYVGRNKEDIFDLSQNEQIEIIKKNLDNLNDEKFDENFLLPDDKNALMATKEKVENQVLENKKGNVLTNAFSFFFGGAKEEEKKELTEEEKETFDEIYTEQSIIDYLNGNSNDNKTTSLNSVFEGVKKFLMNISIEINIAKLELIIHIVNIGNKQNLFIKGMKMNLNYFNKEFDFNFAINDIGYEKNKSFFDKNDLIDLNSDAITFNRDKNNLINLSFGFKNIELNEDLFMCIIIFFNSIKTKKKYKLFHEKKYKNKIIVNKGDENNKKDEENEIIKNIKNFSFMNNFKLSNIPSFSIKNKNNKIEITIIHYLLTENEISFTINIKDSYGVILNDFTFNPKRDGNNYIFHLNSPMNIILSNQSTKIFFLNYLRYQKELSNNNNEKNEIGKNDEMLFGFNYVSYKNIDLGKINMNDYSLDIKINKINIQIMEEEENYQSSFVIDQFKFLYKNKILEVSLNKIVITSNLMSTMILYFIDFESPLLSKYLKLVSPKKDNTNGVNNENNNYIINKNSLDIKNEINYGKLLKEVLNKFKFQIYSFFFIFQANNLIISLNLNEVGCFKLRLKEQDFICVTLNNWNLDMQSSKFGFKTIKIIENNKKTKMKYEIATKIIKGRMESVYLNTNLKEAMEIWENLSFLIKQINMDIILCKIEVIVDDFILKFDQFKYIISKISFSNFLIGSNKNDTFFLKFSEFQMINSNNVRIIYEKELNIDYVFRSSTQNDVIIKCNNDLDIKISQHDISFLIMCIKLPEKSEEEIQLFELNSKNLLPQKNSIDLIKFENKNDNIKIKFALSIDIIVPKLNLCFCLNDNYNKVAEFSIESSKIKSQSTFFEDISDNRLWNELSYSLLLGKLNFKYFYGESNEISILTKRNIDDGKTKNGIKDDNKNQVEIICENNGYTVNINQNEVNVRIDSLLCIYYYFKGAIPIDTVIDNLEQIDFKINKEQNKGTNDFQFQINFNESKFQLNTSQDGKEVLYLDIKEFNIIYRCDSNGEIPYGNYMISLNNISTNIASSNNLRYLFSTDKDFLRIKIKFSENLFSSNILMDDLIINLSYTDILSFFKAYSLNLKLYKLSLEKSEEYLKNLELIKQNKINENTEKKTNIKENSKITPNNFMKRKTVISYAGDFTFKKLDIILIDNSKGSYHPFMNIIIKEINFVLNPDMSFESILSIYLFSYNYISCIWEPTLEKTLVEINNKSKHEKTGKNRIMKILLDKLNINLSDMAISFTLLAFNNWLKNLEKEKKKLEDEQILNFEQFQTKTGEPKNLSKITNNIVINYTGKEIEIIHNEKKIKCKPLEEVELDYINEYNKSKNSPKHITLIYDDEHKFEIPLEKLVTLRHTINNDLWIVSENSISENRSINISLYSPIIFRNKSMYALLIKVSNPNKKDEFLVLQPNHTVGLPLSFIQKDTYFNFKLIDVEIDDEHKIENDDFSKNYNLGVLNQSKYREKIKFKNKILIMNYDSEITNIRTLVISSEYSIINCLPCDIYFTFKNHDKRIKIDKCSQKYIDNSSTYQSDLYLSINTDMGIFKTKNFNIFSLKENEEGNYIEFKDNYYQSFYLLFHLMKNDEENVMVIYAESIIYNNSELNLDISSSNKDNSLCFCVSKNVFLVSSKIEYKEVSIQLKYKNNEFKSKKYSFFDLMEASPYLGINMNNDNGKILPLNIIKKFSYISIKNNPNFKENIMSTVFSIIPCCRITNLLSTQKFFICDKDNLNNRGIINPLKKMAFYFFEKGFNTQLGISVLNLNAKKCNFIIKFQFNRIGIFTLSTDNFIFNIEVRKDSSNGCFDVFIIENNIENSQILMENLTNEGISVFQEKYEQFNQILFPKEKQPLKVYDFESQNFIIQTNNAAKKIMLNNMKDNQIKINDKIIALVEQNKIKMKITFYLIEEFDKLHLSIINNYFKLSIGSIFISIISDNEFQDKKLLNYQRNELLLLVFSKLSISLNVETSTGLLNKDLIEIIFNIDDFSIHNQINDNDDCKFPCILYNTTPFLFFNGHIDFYKSVNILKLESKYFQIGKLELGIDPNFFIKLLDFFGNILYRMNITNFNVHELFINNNIKEEDKALLLINEYMKTKALLDAKDFYFPEINIKFELSKNQLKQLLKEKIGCSKFYIWLAKGLVGSRHRLHLPSSKLPFNYGTIGYFFDEILLFLRKQLEDQLTDIGFKGLFGQIKKIKTLFSSEDVASNNKGTTLRIREPRAFYGKFKYFKDFNTDDAALIKKFYKVHPNFKFKYFPLQVFNNSKVFFLFTTLSLFCVNKKEFGIQLYIDYFMIKEASSNGKKVLVSYNQIIDSQNSCEFDCENEKSAQDIVKAINEEIINNKENYLEV